MFSKGATKVRRKVSFFGQVISRHHSDQMSEKSQVSRIAPSGHLKRESSRNEVRKPDVFLAGWWQLKYSNKVVGIGFILDELNF